MNNSQTILRRLCLGLLPAITLVGGGHSSALAVELAAVFSDHVVLQRERPVPLWGSGTPGERLTISFRDQRVQTDVDASGTWSARLSALTAGGPDTLVVAGSNTVQVSDVLVGEVWLAAGQSNMAMTAGGVVKKGDDALAEMTAADHPQIRFQLEQHPTWRVASAANQPGMPATALAFAVTLSQRLSVPVGMLVRAMPGSATDFWISEEALLNDPTCRASIDTYAQTVYPELQRAYEERRARAATAGGKEPEPPTPPGKPARGAERLGKHFTNLVMPLCPFAIRGFLWDQGENMASIAGAERSAVNAALVRGWRSAWGQGELPFIYFQKPSGGGCAYDPNDPLTQLAEPFAPLPAQVPKDKPGFYRDIYLRLLAVPGTALVPTSDLGGGLHPLRKSSYGRRAAQVALGVAYGQAGATCGPLYAGHAIEGAKVRIRFTHLGKGLVARHDPAVRGFFIAGSDQVFHWADATIDGDSVVVSHAQVAAPVAVRYAWADQIPWANLFNADGLPAQAFRTDTW